MEKHNSNIRTILRVEKYPKDISTLITIKLLFIGTRSWALWAGTLTNGLPTPPFSPGTFSRGQTRFVPDTEVRSKVSN